MVSREHLSITPAGTPKRVMVIGGGMGGMETAVLLKKRGHIPVLCEAADRLGGQFALAGKAPGKEEFSEAVLWQTEETRREGVEIRLGTRVTPEVIEREKPDEVVIAIGSEPVVPDIPGVDLPFVADAHEVLSGSVTPIGNVLILGGGSVGVEAAEYLAVRGATCTVMEIQKKVGIGLGSLRRMFVKKDFAEYGIDQLLLANCESINPGSVVYMKDGIKQVFPCDAVVIATGAKSRDSSAIQKKCNEMEIPYHLIGDALKARDALCATTEGLLAALTI